MQSLQVCGVSNGPSCYQRMHLQGICKEDILESLTVCQIKLWEIKYDREEIEKEKYYRIVQLMASHIFEGKESDHIVSSTHSI